MKTSSFKRWVQALDDLNTLQARILQERLEAKAQKKKVSLLLETPYQQIRCPHCHQCEFVRWGKRNDLQRYKCKICKKTFNSLTATPLARLHRKGHWLAYANCLKDGFSVRRSAEECDIHRNTAFRWRHRFLENSKTIKAPNLQGIVEVSETSFLRSEKGNKRLDRAARKRGSKAVTKDNKSDFVYVLVGRDRNKNTFDSILNDFTTQTLTKTLHSHISKDALFCSDKKDLYRIFTKEHHFRHGQIDTNHGEWVKKDIVHLKNVISYHQRLREWIFNRFRGVATKYLDNYISWLRELDEFDNSIPPETILLRAKKSGVYKDQPHSVT